ncbi:MAG TPA: putative porin [Kiritimatiellia bacterium]|nr:putative porin [Kiritimatiellia bacterium]
MKKSVMLALLAGAITGAVAVTAQETKAPSSWADKVTLKGDVRVRYEDIEEDGKADRQRDRYRLRLGLDAKPSDEVKIGARLTSSDGGDRISGNSTFTDAGSKKDVFIDLAFIEYSPAAIDGFTLIGGKMENPYIAVSDQIWDGDYTPEGFAAKYRVGGDLKAMLAAGYHWLEERSSDEDDAKQLGVQGAVKLKTCEKSSLLAGVGYYLTQDLEGRALFDGKSFGNSTTKVVDGDTTNSLFASEFEVLEFFAQFDANFGLPISVYGSYAVNQDVDDEDTAWIAGLTLGKAKEVGSIEGGYNFRVVEKDAVLGALTDSDSFGGGTNGEGHKFYVRYQLAKNLQLGATYFLNSKDPDGKDTDYERLQVDLAARF